MTDSTVSNGSRTAPPSLRPSRLNPYQVDVLAALIATLPAPASNENARKVRHAGE